MTHTANLQAGRQHSIPWLVMLGAGLLVLAAITLLAAPLGYRLGMLPLRTALLTVFRWGAYLAATAAGVSAVGLVLLLFRPKDMRRGVSLAGVSLLLAISLFAVPYSWRLGPAVPPIHDITTDTQDPPQFVAVVPLNTPDRTVYEGDRIASLQREAYPDLQPVVLSVPPAQAYERALETVHEMGWDLVEAEPASRRIEATDTTFWFGFKDDVVIRVRPDGEGSRVDVRSLSRVGGGDVGTNARRIRAYVAAMTAQ